MNLFSAQVPSRGRIVLFAAAIFAFGLSCLTAHSQSVYPNKSVRVVVPYPPGGPNDIIARLLAQKLTERLKQTFVIDNRPGATGLTGTDNVAKSPSDGYTLLVSASVHVIYPALFKKVPFDPLTDFVGVTVELQRKVSHYLQPILSHRFLNNLA